MAHRALNRAVDFIHRWAALPVAGQRTDRQLLNRFAEDGDQASFGELVQRHGPLVWGVCRRVLQNDHDADDAFQATFLVLSRKASATCWHESVKHWLYEVAYRVALRARASRDRRRDQEREAASAGRTDVPGEVSWRDVQLALDDELHRLPAKYRAPLMLCYLEGQTQEEAARQLGCSVAALHGRLWRARELLRERLARRGLELSAVLLAAMIASNAPAAVPSALLTATVHAGVQMAAGQAASSLVSARVLELTEAALRTMFLGKIKVISAFVIGLALLVAAGSAIAHFYLPDRPKQQLATPEATPTVGGVIRSVGFSGSLVSSVTLYGHEETFTFAKSLEPTLDDGTAMKRRDIGPGTYVRLTLADDKKTVTALAAIRPGVSGAVKDMDDAKKTITLTDRSGEHVFPVAADAKVVVNGKEAKLADVKNGMAVHLQLSLDRKIVHGIRTQTGAAGTNN
jgi:RNA polymerase sigma factor (sigma-70 family)